MRQKLLRVTTAVLATSLTGAVLAGCGSESSADEATPTRTATAGYPLTIDNCGVAQTFTARPSRVVIMNGASVGEVESFVRLGLAHTIVANAQHYGVSDDPAMTAAIDALPTGGVKLNKNFDIPAEQLLALKPDLVVSTWSGAFDSAKGFATRAELGKLGIRTLVNPVNCAYGKAGATDAEKAAHERAGVESSLEFLTLLGTVFDVPATASTLVRDLRTKIETTSNAVKDAAKLKGIIAYPGMAMMNANGLPAVMTGGIYDDVLDHAGVTNSFAGKGTELTSTMSAEQLASAQVDILVLGAFTEGEDLDAEATKLFAAYPQWNAAKTKNYVKVSDGVYLGPLNAIAIDKIAKAAHPDKF